MLSVPFPSKNKKKMLLQEKARAQACDPIPTPTRTSSNSQPTPHLLEALVPSPASRITRPATIARPSTFPPKKHPTATVIPAFRGPRNTTTRPPRAIYGTPFPYDLGRHRRVPNSAPQDCHRAQSYLGPLPPLLALNARQEGSPATPREGFTTATAAAAAATVAIVVVRSFCRRRYGGLLPLRRHGVLPISSVGFLLPVPKLPGLDYHGRSARGGRGE